MVVGLLSPTSRGEDGAGARLEAEGSLVGLGMQRQAVRLTKRHGGAGTARWDSQAGDLGGGVQEQGAGADPTETSLMRRPWERWGSSGFLGLRWPSARGWRWLAARDRAHLDLELGDGAPG